MTVSVDVAAKKIRYYLDGAAIGVVNSISFTAAQMLTFKPAVQIYHIGHSVEIP